MSPPGASASLVERAEGAADLLGEAVQESDETGMLTSHTVALLREVGFMRHFVKEPYGGSNGKFTELLSAVSRVARANPSAAWCGSVTASLCRIMGFLPEAGRRMVWARGPDALIAGAISPRGTAKSVDGGWLLSGRWSYVSAVDHADWLILAAREDDSEAVRLLAVPNSDIVIDQTWSSVGMRATSSNTVTVDAQLVPEYLSVGFDALTGIGLGGQQAVPLAAVNGLFFCAPLLGAAEGALARWAVLLAGKISTDDRGPGPGAEYYEDAYARSSGEIDAARLLLERIATTADSWSPEAFAPRSQRDSALAADLLSSATLRLVRTAGTAGQRNEEPLQHYLRDVQTAASHIVLQFPQNAKAYTQQRISDLVP
jgi:alkylation response protein AidB-like acyl-CoA dehydrogenase